MPSSQIYSQRNYQHQEDADEDPENTFSILISSDNHLGFKETDPVIGYDSFRVFDEMLETANKENVDFVLLGGDLFHDNRPSASTYFKAS